MRAVKASEMINMSIKLLAIGLCINLIGACTTAPPVVAPTSPAEVGELRAGTGFLKGYLAPAEALDSLALLPPPPIEGSPALSADTATFNTLTKFQGTPRGAMAISDANLNFPEAASVFSCALGMQISEKGTPNLNMLLRRTLTDTALATYKAKNKYARVRPFIMLKAGSCTPKEEAFLAKDGSYPSGHSAIGWGWALLLTELAPDRKDALLQRGRAFAQGRAICGVHWQSDIDAGRLVGSAAVAQLHANAVFNAQMSAARAEIARARVVGAPPTAACLAEAATIAGSSLSAP
ncbi:phosphatase PAP2 family protein [Variovorax sp. J22R115]|uniref:acid phosphatase n=1 Tax=Variovorax sp. J22R115 TaxID=3053509 RepID=UPI00257792C0|nr:phosphatase PAP2 family protein [Variovorax sp. J22R115]MDM0047440.1 phosphatase PAP2 family protein [Variovorax sp. J22R115]